ncbi:TPA_asm: acintoc8 [Capsaspora MELD virus 1]|nr:TPA_asm: acintoc8 [Capsaspora MELD virus 1]
MVHKVYGLGLSEKHLKGLRQAWKELQPVILKLNPEALEGVHELPLSEKQIQQIEMRKAKKKGYDLKLSKAQLKLIDDVKEGGSLMSGLTGIILKNTLLQGLKAVAKPLATGAITYAGGEAAKKIFGGAMLKISEKEVEELLELAMSDLLPEGAHTAIKEKIGKGDGSFIVPLIGHGLYAAQTQGRGLYGAQSGNGLYGAQSGNGLYGAQSGNGVYGAQSGNGLYGAQSGNGVYGAQSGGCMACRCEQ